MKIEELVWRERWYQAWLKTLYKVKEDPKNTGSNALKEEIADAEWTLNNICNAIKELKESHE